MENSELDYVLAQLQARKGSWPQIGRDTGLDYSWLSKLARGVFDDPGIKRINRLAAHLRLLERQDAERGAQQAREAAA